MGQSGDIEAGERRRGAHFTGLILAIGTALSLALIAHHPMADAERGRDVFAAIIRMRQMDHAVHGGLMIIFGAFAFCFTYFARCLGLNRAPVLLGLILYNAGCVFIIGAALIDGFVTPDIADRYVAATADESKIGYNLLVLCGLAIQSASKFGIVSISAAIICWSVALIKRTNLRRVCGAIGLTAGVLPLVAILGTDVILLPPILLGILATQSLWNLAVAFLLIRDFDNLGAERTPSVNAKTVLQPLDSFG